MWYKLDENRQPVKVTLEEMNTISTAVEKTKIDKNIEVSTVFLRLDHNHSGTGPPLLWETMVFMGDDDIFCQRYSSEADAKIGHERIVTKYRTWWSKNVWWYGPFNWLCKLFDIEVKVR